MASGFLLAPLVPPGYSWLSWVLLAPPGSSARPFYHVRLRLFRGRPPSAPCLRRCWGPHTELRVSTRVVCGSSRLPSTPGSLRPPLAPSGLPWLPQASPGSQASQDLPGLPQPNSPPGFPKCPGIRGGCESPGHARGSRGLTTAARGKSPGAADRILEFSTGSPKAAFALALGLLGFLGFQPYSSLARVWGQRGASLWPV